MSQSGRPAAVIAVGLWSMVALSGCGDASESSAPSVPPATTKTTPPESLSGAGEDAPGDGSSGVGTGQAEGDSRRSGNGGAETDNGSSSIPSPLEIPLPTDVFQGSNDNYADRLPELKQLIRDACGGSDCVSVIKVGQGESVSEFEGCDKIRSVQGNSTRTDPETSQIYLQTEAGDTITVVVNADCADLPPQNAPSGPGGEGEVPDGTGTDGSDNEGTGTDDPGADDAGNTAPDADGSVGGGSQDNGSQDSETP